MFATSDRCRGRNKTNADYKWILDRESIRVDLGQSGLHDTCIILFLFDKTIVFMNLLFVDCFHNLLLYD